MTSTYVAFPTGPEVKPPITIVAFLWVVMQRISEVNTRFYIPIIQKRTLEIFGEYSGVWGAITIHSKDLLTKNVVVEMEGSLLD